MVERYLSLNDLVKEIPNVSRDTWMRIIDRGEIRTTRIGKRRFVAESDLQRYLERNRSPIEVGA